MTQEEKGAYRVGVAVLPLLRRCLGLNHELNKPVAGIVGHCQFLLDDKDKLKPEQTLTVEEIRDCAIQIQTILEELSAEKANLSEKMDLKAIEQDMVGESDTKATD